MRNVVAPAESSQKNIRSALGSTREAPVPPLARERSVPDQLLLLIETDPPSVKFPELVTVPDRVIPLTVPVPPTLVTEPTPLAFS